MAAEIKKEIGLEIGHVLFIDIVAYSKLLIKSAERNQLDVAPICKARLVQ